MKKTTQLTLFSLLLSFVVVFPQQNSNAGLFDCRSPKKWSGYSKLRTAFMKDPQMKTQDDWFKGYMFARIYTGSPKCFDSKDVAIMNKWVTSYNQACLQNQSWNYSCKLYSGTSTLAAWVYEGYK